MSSKGSSSKDNSPESPAPTIAVQERSIVVKQPDLYHGDRSKLDSFLMSMDIYILFNQHLFGFEAAKVVYAMSYLRGTAFNWAQTYMINFMENTWEPEGLLRHLNEFKRYQQGQESAKRDPQSLPARAQGRRPARTPETTGKERQEAAKDRAGEGGRRKSDKRVDEEDRALPGSQQNRTRALRERTRHNARKAADRQNSPETA
jgi:hypothetical protein